MNETWTHTTVLLNPAVQALNIRPHLTYVDGTFGRGGHSRLILSLLSAQGRLIAYDKDPEAVNVAKQWGESRLDIHHGSFAHMAQSPCRQSICQIARMRPRKSAIGLKARCT